MNGSRMSGARVVSRGWAIGCAVLPLLAGSVLGQEQKGGADGAGGVSATTVRAEAKTASPMRTKFANPTNAALVYLRHFTMRNDALRKAMESHTTEGNYSPEGETAKALKEGKAYLEGILRASRIKDCDFGIEYERGIEALLPHLGEMRAAARLCNMEAQRRLAEGDRSGGAEYLAAIFRMAEHCRSDGVLISSLVSIAITSMAIDSVTNLANAGRLGPVELRVIAKAVDAINTEDLGGTRASLLGEKIVFLGSLEKYVDMPTPSAEFSAFLQSLQIDQDACVLLEGLDRADKRAQLDEAARAYDAAIEAWDKTDAAERLGAIGDQVARGDYGLVALHFMPAVSKSYSSQQQGLSSIKKLKTLLKEKMNEETGEVSGSDTSR